ncbi:hypothetical protein GCM10010269_51560 [Streptomyces humidus]|uniref:Uncharacterized protein n=1 Tax=Streptomyces humidus TaxID=52259 RepID=A0A918G0U3_9ACTN|nr:hypothetical protein [Streptomyces humidus]GGS06230.1 hypothetical protein GCM10010269_51560 [Streptomyces humidus]
MSLRPRLRPPGPVQRALPARGAAGPLGVGVLTGAGPAAVTGNAATVPRSSCGRATGPAR